MTHRTGPRAGRAEAGLPRLLRRLRSRTIAPRRHRIGAAAHLLSDHLLCDAGLGRDQFAAIDRKP